MKNKGKTIITLTGLVTVTIHILNRIQYSNATSKDLMSCPENNYYEWRFGKIRYRKKGKGNPILLLHDLTPGSSSYEFNKIENILAADHKVYTLDFLGYGLSEKPNMTYTNYLFVQQITDFIKSVISEKTDVVATGDAVPVAIMASHNDPEIIKKMFFINPRGLYELNKIPSRKTKVLKAMVDIPIIGTFIYNLLTSDFAFKKAFRENYFYNTDSIDNKDILTYIEAAHLSDYKSKYSFSSYLGKYMNANIVQALKEMKQDAVIIAGEAKKDNDLIIQNYKYFNPKIKSVWISKTKQLPHLELPGTVAKCIKDNL